VNGENTAMTDSFSAELWRGITDIYDAILAHRFIAGLTDGSLPAGAFAFYVLQDALYLRQYARALANVASKAPDTAGTEMFARHAANIVTVEMDVIAVSDALGPDLAGPSASGCGAISARRAGTSGCSGTLATVRRAGRSREPV
jgi:hypothetical protein